MSYDSPEIPRQAVQSTHKGKLTKNGRAAAIGHHLSDRGLPSSFSDDDFSPLLEKLGQRSVTKNESNSKSAPNILSNSKESNYLKFSTTDCEKNPNVKVEKKFESDIMRRVLDNIHLPCDDIGARTSAGSAGVPWSKTPPKKRSSMGTGGTDPMGPGRYNTAPCYEEKLSNMRYIEANKVSDGMKWERKMKDQIKYYDSPRKCSTLATVSFSEFDSEIAQKRKIQMSFSGSTRFDAPEYRSEKYVKTTGMALTLDYDRKYDKRLPINVSGYSERDCHSTKLLKPQFEYNTALSLDVDCGTHATLNTTMIKSPLKLSKAFKSKIQSGYTYPTPTSGNLIGPGSFPGADTPAVIIKNPGKKSPVFLMPRPYERTRAALPDSLATLPTFTDINNRGSLFSLSDASGKKNNHLAEWTKKKIDQIYPRLKTYKV